jgi:hypothetical protein
MPPSRPALRTAALVRRSRLAAHLGTAAAASPREINRSRDGRRHFPGQLQQILGEAQRVLRTREPVPDGRAADSKRPQQQHQCNRHGDRDRPPRAACVNQPATPSSTTPTILGAVQRPDKEGALAYAGSSPGSMAAARMPTNVASRPAATTARLRSRVRSGLVRDEFSPTIVDVPRGGVVDRLAELGLPVTPCNGGEAPMLDLG